MNIKKSRPKRRGSDGEGEGKGRDGERRGMTRNDEQEMISTPSRNNCYNSTVITPHPWENSKSERRGGEGENIGLPTIRQ